MSAKTILASQPLANPLHEKFARLVAEGGKLGISYKMAGLGGADTAVHTNASNLNKKPEVAARIAYLKNTELPALYEQGSRDVIAEVFGISKKELVEMTLQIYTEASDEKDKRLALDAIKLVHHMMNEEQKLWAAQGLLDNAKNRAKAADDRAEKEFEEGANKTKGDLDTYVELIKNSNNARRVMERIEDADS